MRKTFTPLFLIVLSFFLLGSANLVKSQNIVVNGDFESWTGGQPDGWTIIDPGITVTQETTIIHGGSSSASVDVTTGSQSNTDLWQTVSVTGGTTYDVSVWVYHTEGHMKARLCVDGYQGYSDNTITGQWQEMTYTYTPAADADIEVGLRFYDQSGFDGSEIVYVDDFVMTPQGGGGGNTQVLYLEEFTSDLGATTQYSVTGDNQVWEWAASYGNPPGCSKMNGYSGGAQENEDWLISNAINCDNYSNIMLSFDHARNYADNSGLFVLVSNDYDGVSDPTTSGTWNDITSQFTFPDPGGWDFIDAGTVDISSYTGTTTYIAFKYTSDNTAAATWEVDNVKVEGDLDISVFIAGSFNTWNPSDPDYEMSLNANGLFELTKNLPAGTNEYKAVEDGNWYPGDNQQIILTTATDTTWKYNYTANLVTHTRPTVAGNFWSLIGGSDWDAGEPLGEMEDPDGDDIYTLEVLIPAGNYECKITLNKNWDQSTGGNVPFISDGVNPTIFTYDFPNNITLVSGPPPPTATITFIVDDSGAGNYDGFNLKGSWGADGSYDPSWDGGAEHSAFYDDGTNGDAVAGDHIWTCQLDLVVDGGANTWEWGVNDTEHNWIAGNWQFTVPDETAQTLTWTVPDVPALVINEIMYNSPGADEEWIELYNNTAEDIDLENWKVLDNDASHAPIIIPAGYSISAGGYFTIEIGTNGDFPFTPDYDGSGNFSLNNSGDAVRIWDADGILTDIVVYDDGSPWPDAPDGDGPSLSLIDPDLDNSLPESWAASLEDGGTPGERNFPPVPYITVLDPNGGEYIQQGQQYTINWTYGNWDGNIEIQIFRDGGPEQMIVHNLPVSNGSFTWDVWNSIEIADDYKIVIRGIDADTPSDESDDFFSIIPPYEIPNLVFTEIMYNPPESGNDSLEFIEIYNNGTDTVALEGYHFTEGVEFIFPETEILPDTFLLVAKNAAAMMSTFGVESLEWTGGALSNGGEDIELRDAYDNVVDYVDYDDSTPWDTIPDGNGPSLTLCNPDLDNSLPENWTHSVYFAAINADGDSIWATPGFGCQVSLMANFIADTTLISVGDSVMFTDMSTGNPTSWSWTFEGGTPATYDGQQPPYIYYNEAGTWDVTLVVSDGTETDSITKVDYITVSEAYELLPPENLTGEEVNMDIVLSWEPPGGAPTGFEDDFESYEDFVLEFSPWTNIDVDGSTTYGMQGVDWPNAYSEQAFIIFNPSMTTPPVEDMPPHSGDKLAACFAATTPPNDDWMVTPLVNLADNSHVSFWAKSYTDDYGLERFRVGVSTTGLDPADFTIISAGDYEEAPVEDWTEFTYDLSAYNGQQVYVAIQCVSNDAFILLIDDFYIGADKSSIAYNPSQPVIGKGVKAMNYTAQPAQQPAVVPERTLRDDPVLEGYNVYRDDNQINENVVEGTTYTDIEPSIGSHDYYVTAVYDVGESEPSNIFSIVYTGIHEMTSESIVVYPNPSDGKFTVNLPADTQVELNVMDLTGKTIYHSTAKGSAVIDLSRLYKGMYLLNIYDSASQTNVVKKLIVK